MARNEKDFLNTMDTYIKVTKDRLRDGRIIDAHEELIIMEKMVGQRIEEIEGKAKWETPEKDFGEMMLKKLTEGGKDE